MGVFLFLGMLIMGSIFLIGWVYQVQRKDNIASLMRKALASDEFALELVQGLEFVYGRSPIRRDMLFMDVMFAIHKKSVAGFQVLNCVPLNTCLLIFTKAMLREQLGDNAHVTYDIFVLTKKTDTQEYEVRSDMSSHNIDKTQRQAFALALLEYINR